MKMVKAFVKTSVAVPLKLNTALLYDPAIPLLGIYSKEFKEGTLRGSCMSLFRVAVFTVMRR
jgi:hypothetical protein